MQEIASHQRFIARSLRQSFIQKGRHSLNSNDEIPLMKDQFDKLVAVLDDDLLPSTSPTPSENSQKYV